MSEATTTLRTASQIRRICRLIFCRESLDVRGFDVLMQLRSEQDHEGTSSAQGDGIWDLPGANVSDFKHLDPFQAVLACANEQMAVSSSFQFIDSRNVVGECYWEMLRSQDGKMSYGDQVQKGRI